MWSSKDLALVDAGHCVEFVFAFGFGVGLALVAFVGLFVAHKDDGSDDDQDGDDSGKGGDQAILLPSDSSSSPRKGITVASGKMWQDLPEYPGKHLHSKFIDPLMQKPLFRQGLESHSLTSLGAVPCR